MRLLKLDQVLVASDLEATSDAAVASACELSRIAGAALTLLHVAAPRQPVDERAVAASLERAGVDRRGVAVEHVWGEPVPAIQAEAERIEADLVVLGPHRGRMSSRPSGLGGTAYGVVSGAQVPCLVLGERLHLPLERVLIPIDLSDTARGALMVGLTWTSALRTRAGTAELSILHVETEGRKAVEDDRIERELEVLRRAGGTWAGVTPRARFAAGDDVAATIAAHADGHDMIVLGTRGLSATRTDAGIGSTAAALLKQTHTPLLLVPPAVWRHYVEDAD